MGCPTTVELEDSLTFSICTHDPSTSVHQDADSLPSYRVYENETGTAIDSGTMAKLDDANTTGFYSKTLNCTTANGYEIGKTYSIYVEATVNGDVGSISYGFKVQDTGLEVWDSAHTTPSRLKLSAAQIVPGTVDAGSFAPTINEFEAADITMPLTSHYKNRIIIFTSGSLNNHAVSITGYSLVGGKGHFLVTDMVVAPSNGTTFIII